MQKSLRLPRKTHIEPPKPPKTSRAPGVLTLLTSKSFSRAGVVQILATSTPKNAPSMPFSNDFDFQISRASPKVLRARQFLTILTSKSLSRRRGANFATSSAADPLRPPVLIGADFPTQRSHKTMEKRSISRNSYPPNPHVAHLCCITSARSHLLVDRSSAATLSIVGS